jgi:hypothetical protein
MDCSSLMAEDVHAVRRKPPGNPAVDGGERGFRTRTQTCRCLDAAANMQQRFCTDIERVEMDSIF